MDENAARSLLEQVAGAPAPPSLVDIAKARRIGRRHLRLRRYGAPVATVSAVAVVAGLVASGTLPIADGGRPAPGANSAATHSHAFNPLVPYMTFGWLPPGYSVSAKPMHVYSIMALTVETLEASDHSGGSIAFMVFPVGQCHLTGPLTGPGRHRSQLTCGGLQTPVGLGPVAVTGPIPGVLGGHAYWWADTGRKYHGLVLRGDKAWVDIDSTIAPATELRIAAHVRFGSGRPLAFPFRLAGLPSRWRIGSSTPWTLGGRPVSSGLMLGPGPSYNQVEVSAAHANMPGFCGRDTGWQWVTVGGHRGILRTVYGDHFQTLCFEDVGGLAVAVTVSRPFSGAPLAAAEGSGGVIDVFLHHLRLLGPDPARWTTHPITG